MRPTLAHLVFLLLHMVSAHVSYKGHKLVSLTELDVDQLELVAGLAGSSPSELNEYETAMVKKLDFWSYCRPCRSAAVRVPPDYVAGFEDWLGQNRIKYDVLDDDLEVLLEWERRARTVHPTNRERRDIAEVSDALFDALPPTQDIYDWLTSLASLYDIMTIETIGQSVEGRDITLVKISDGEEDKPWIFIDAGMHAREHMAIGTALWIIRSLVMEYGDDDDITRLVDRYDWYIIPIVNPDGYEYTHTGDRMWRRNRRPNPVGDETCVGVDLNRNFNYPFGGPGSSRRPCSISYRGTHAFSEPEVEVIRKLVSSRAHKPALYTSLHAYSQFWLLPWAFTTQPAGDLDDMERVARLATASMRSVNNRTYEYGQSAQLLYRCGGTSMDWMKGRMGVRYSYTVELYPESGYGTLGFLINATVLTETAREAWAGIQRAAAEIDLTQP